MDMLHTTEVMAIFVIFWPILAKIWLPWQRPLDLWNQKCLLWIGQRPKLVAMVTPLCPLCTVESDEFPDSTSPISKPNSAWICRLQLKLWPFL